MSASIEAPELVPLCHVTLQVGEMRRLGTPRGRRLIGSITGSRWEGERFRASQVGSGADWLTYHDDEMATVDVRLTLETDDQALVLVEYRGRSDRRHGSITTVLWFETDDPRYEWLNRRLAVGRGAHDRSADVVSYDVFEVA